MQKYIVPATLGFIGAGALTTWYIIQKRNKSGDNESVLAKAGIADQLDMDDVTQLENTKMMSEGSQYGVNYYNEQRDT